MSDFNTDLIDALNEIQNPYTDGRANYGKYATLSECLSKAKGTLGKHHLAISQAVHSDPDRVVTSIKHISGDCISDGGVPLHCVDKNNPQKMGAAITYARRYGLCAILGVVGDEDDDAQSATAPEALPKPKPTKKPTLDVPMPRIVAEEIPFDPGEAKEDWPAWAKKIGELIDGSRDSKALMETWTTTKPDREKLREKHPELHAKLAEGAKKRRAVLENKSE